ncbi:MAG: 2-dehydropantoate 2-reductase [Synergistaceae bacterium]|jgi:2-dehydropantoate 2-reductase|nr:2-dehydropantoate 2-reductase [Synergistaceae bacterium]
MKKIETIALAGLGAVGASYLAEISEHIPMENIRVAASGERAGRIRSGVTVNGKKYFFPVFEPNDDAEPADLAIFAVKNHHLARALEDARKQIGGETVIMSFLNGVTSEATIAGSYGANVLFSIVMGIDATREGDSTVYSALGTIQFGEAVNREGEYSQNVLKVKDFFERTGIPYEILSDMKWALWKKFMLNCGANQTSAVLRCPYGALQASAEARAIILGAMEEVVSLASYEGVSLSKEDIGDAFARLDRLSPDGRTSMCQDVEAMRKTEVEIFGATVADLARRHGVYAPVNELLRKLIVAIESSYSIDGPH